MVAAMKILAFETSCDDTAVAVVEDGTKVLASTRISQVEHNEYGGVVPEIAARLHAERWPKILEKCLADAGLEISEIDFFAVTKGPGLQTSLLSGTTAASFLSLFFGKKLIPVHHIFGHMCSVLLERKKEEIQFPILALVASGGHTELFHWNDFCEVKKLGGTIDDAAGEAFDKVAKMLGLGYPGGPEVSKWAKKGNRQKFKFPRIFLGKDSLDFSFSGLKAAVFRQVELCKNPKDKTFVADVCASFEQAVMEIFLKKVGRVLDRFPEIKNVCFAGGVSANTFLRENLENFLEKRGLKLLLPKKLEYCTDNAAMIAGAAYWMMQKNPEIAQVQFVDADPRLVLI